MGAINTIQSIYGLIEQPIGGPSTLYNLWPDRAAKWGPSTLYNLWPDRAAKWGAINTIQSIYGLIEKQNGGHQHYTITL